MNLTKPRSSERVRRNLWPHLPEKTSLEGSTCRDLQVACNQFISDTHAGRPPSPDPYDAKWSREDKLVASRNLSSLARDSQKDFSQRPNPMRLHQLQDSLNSMGQQAQERYDQASEKRSDLRRGYAVQVAKSVGWMMATGASLMLGLVAAPVSVPLVAVTAGMAIKSISESRAANKELASKQPMYDREMESQEVILADAQEYGKAVSDWEEALRVDPRANPQNLSA